MRKASDDNSEIQRRKGSEKKKENNSDKGKGTLKKAKSGFAKIKNQIQNTVKSNKIMQFVKKNTLNIPKLLTKEQSKALLPKLQKIMLPKILKQDYTTNKTKFEEIGNQLTHSMVMFERQNDDRNDIWAIDLQTQKCYKTIPQFYFRQHISERQFAPKLALSKNHKVIEQNVYCLMDYLDQVEFNINQQTAAKIKIFMNFIMCMDSIQGLVNINLSNLQKNRNFIGTLRDIIISRSFRINQQRVKKERIQQTLSLLQVFKKMKQLENKLNTQISLGHLISHDPKSKLGSAYAQYCQIHNETLKKFCCKGGSNLCKYWDINYFIEKGYQDNFMRMVRSYLFEVIDTQVQIENYKKVFILNKKNFMSTPSSVAGGVNMLDESYDVDAYDHVELITKVHIQKQIIAMFEQGMHRYNFSTSQLQKQLSEYVFSYLYTFIKEILSSAESKQALGQLNDSVDSDYFNSEKLKDKISKLSWLYFDKLIEMIIIRLEYLNIRLLCLVQKMFVKVEELQGEQPQRFQLICSYLSSLLHSTLQISDEYLTKLLKNKFKQSEKTITIFKSKDQIVKQFDIQIQNMKKVSRHCQKWLMHIVSAQKTYKVCKDQIQKLLNKSEKKIKMLFYAWSPRVYNLNAIIIKSMSELQHRIIISRDLREKMQEDNWQIVEIKTQIYNDIGYVIGGIQFLQQQERHQRSLLSNSILMERSISESEKISNNNPSTQYNKQIYSSRFKINPHYITVDNCKFKIVSSTEHMIKFLRKYLQLYDDGLQIDKRVDLQVKLTELIVMYCQYLKDLIVKGDALKLGKITTKAITAKHLVVAYIQMQVIDAFYASFIMKSRVGLTKEECAIMHDKIAATQLDIRKKYMKIMEMRIIDSIQMLSFKQKGGVETEQLASIPKNISASIDLFSNLMLEEQEYIKFIDMDSNWVTQLINKLNKLSNGKEMKSKCLQFLEQQISPFSKYVPRILSTIRTAIY